jgi:hypothetical protein
VRRSDADEQEARGRQVDRALRGSEAPLDVPGGEPLEADPHADRTRTFRTVGFSRMRTDWRPEEAIVMEQISLRIENIIQAAFHDAFVIRDRLYRIVREPQVREDGTVIAGADGRPLWQLDEDGMPVEDWGLLSDRDRHRFSYEITIRLVEWGQIAAGQWGDAMMGKGIYEEAFARGFLAPSDSAKRLTVDDRTQAGAMAALDQRYHALFRSILSRRADALVKSMQYLEQRLRETLPW